MIYGIFNRNRSIEKSVSRLITILFVALFVFTACSQPKSKTVDKTLPGEVVFSGSPTITDDSITLNWTAPSPGEQEDGTTASITAYKVSVKDKDGNTAKDKDGNDISIADLQGDATSLSISNLAPETDYTIEVTTVNSLNKETTSTQTLTTTQVPDDKTLPGEVVFSGSPTITDDSIALNWTAPTPGLEQDGTPASITAYKVSVRDQNGNTAKDKDGNDISIADLQGDATTLTIPNLAPETEYTIEVTTVNSLNKETTSTQTLTTTADKTLPGEIVFSDTNTIEAESITLNWTAPSPGEQEDGTTATITAYKVSVRDQNGNTAKDKDGYDIFIADLQGDATTLTIPNLAPETEYTIEVTTVNSLNKETTNTQTLSTITKMELRVKDFSPVIKIPRDSTTDTNPLIINDILSLNDSTPYPSNSTVNLEILVNDSPGTISDFTFSSSEESIATVDTNGTVTGLTKGITTITAENSNSGLTTSIDLEFATAPGKVTNIQIMSDPDPNVANQIIVTWDRPTDDGTVNNNLILRYEVEAFNPSGNTLSYTHSINDNNREVKIGNVTMTGTYTIRVTAISIAGRGDDESANYDNP